MTNFKPKRYVALFLSILSPGLGQIYKSEVKKGVILMLIAYLAFPIGVYLNLPDYFWGMAIVCALVLLIMIYTLADSFQSGEVKNKLNWYNKWYFCLGLGAIMSLPSLFLENKMLNRFEAFRFKGESNLPTLFDGDYVVVSKKFYLARPIERFDFVAFAQEDNPKTEADESALRNIKRVIGLPGDQIEVKDAKVFLNGAPVKVDYGIWVDGGTEQSGPYFVPEGSYFLLGDNRDRSRDSRHYDNPYIPAKNILGKLSYIYFNIGRPERIGTYIE